MKVNANPATYKKSPMDMDANKLHIVHKIAMIMRENIIANVVSLSKNNK